MSLAPCLVHMSQPEPPTYDAAATLPPVDADLAVFWCIFKLGHRAKLLNEYFGIECVEDLEDVHVADLKTISFADWSERNLSVVDRNRLRRAVNHYQVQIRSAEVYKSPRPADISVPVTSDTPL
jgi:hypothetical protein